MTTRRVESASNLALSVAARALATPQRVWSQSLTAAQEMLRSLTGSAAIQPENSDKRFRDPVWTSNPGYRALMQSYLAWSNGVAARVDGLDVPARDKLRARIATDLVTDALAPTNALMTNPAAMKATLEQGGRNLVAGMQHFVADMTKNGGLPAMVDKSKFAVGESPSSGTSGFVHRVGSDRARRPAGCGGANRPGHRRIGREVARLGVRRCRQVRKRTRSNEGICGEHWANLRSWHTAARRALDHRSVHRAAPRRAWQSDRRSRIAGPYDRAPDLPGTTRKGGALYRNR